MFGDTAYPQVKVGSVIVVSAPRMLTTREAAEIIGVSVRTLQRYVTEGRMRPTYRLPGGRMRWDLDDLRAQLRVVDADPGDQDDE